MEIPTPVDLNRFKNILANAKKVMKTADEKFPTGKGNKVIDEGYGGYDNYQQAPMYSEFDEREPVYENHHHHSDAGIEVRDYTENDVLNSRLPDNVKQAMLSTPIPKMNFAAVNSKFTLDGLEDLIEKPTKRPQFKSPGVPLREAAGGGVPTEQMVTISISQLNEIIDNRVNKILAEMYTKTISEQTIKKTINTLIKEGKITTKK